MIHPRDYWRSLTLEEQNKLDKDVNSLIDEKLMQAMREVMAELKARVPSEVDPYDFAILCVVRPVGDIRAFIDDLRGESDKVIPFIKPELRKDDLPY